MYGYSVQQLDFHTLFMFTLICRMTIQKAAMYTHMDVFTNLGKFSFLVLLLELHNHPLLPQLVPVLPTNILVNFGATSPKPSSCTAGHYEGSSFEFDPNLLYWYPAAPPVGTSLSHRLIHFECPSISFVLVQLKINKTDERILKLSQINLCILHHPNPCETTTGMSRDSYDKN